MACMAHKGKGLLLQAFGYYHSELISEIFFVSVKKLLPILSSNY